MYIMYTLRQLKGILDQVLPDPYDLMGLFNMAP